MATALLLLIVQGLSWVLLGSVVGHIERRGYSLVLYQIFTCAVCVNPSSLPWKSHT